MRLCLSLTLMLAAGLALPCRAQSQAPIGVPECDNFLNAYERCISERVAPSERTRVAAEARQVRDETREAARDPSTRAALPQQCARMQQMMSDWMAQHNCRF